MLWLLALVAFAVLTALYCIAIEACFEAMPRHGRYGLMGLLLLLLLPIVRPSPSDPMTSAGYDGPLLGQVIGGLIAFVAGALGAWFSHRKGTTSLVARRLERSHASDRGNGG